MIIRKIYGKDKITEIKTLDEWKILAPPERDYQWAVDHSAMEFAKYILENKKDFDVKLKNVLVKYTNYETFDFYGEYTTKLKVNKEIDYEERWPRHHDGLLINQDLVVGIEAKATESLDDYLGDKPIYDNEITHINRYHKLSKDILNKNPTECENIRYQLLSAVAGTVIEAYKQDKNKALFLLITFKTKIVTENMLLRNKNDLNSFLSYLNKNDDGSYSFPLADCLGIKIYIDSLII